MQKITIPKGTRDFSPQELQKRYYIIEIIRKNFEKFGFSPIETPSFENLSILNGKYGQENERLIFRILNSGNFMKNFMKNFDKKNYNFLKYFNTKTLLPEISKKGLRYDLTIPFIRYVVMHKNNINFPFKRYQIQPVWRSDNPQKGRFREFYQCDADIIGCHSLWQELELLQLYDSIFTDLKLPVTIQINHRGLLIALIEKIGIKKYWPIFINILDKWDKIGTEKIYEEMFKKGIPKKAIDKFNLIFKKNTNFKYQINKFSKLLSNSEKGMNALNELNFIWEKSKNLGMKNSKLYFNEKLARGLDYYTGIIYEVLPRDKIFSSIGGGGRYDELTKIFGIKNLPSIGISLGLDRIYIIMENYKLFEKQKIKKPLILFINFGEKEAFQAMKKIKILRNKNIPSELYPEKISLKKQIKYANKKGIYWIVLMGEKEISNKIFLIKNLKNGIQKSYNNLTKLVKDYNKL